MNTKYLKHISNILSWNSDTVFISIIPKSPAFVQKTATQIFSKVHSEHTIKTPDVTWSRLASIDRNFTESRQRCYHVSSDQNPDYLLYIGDYATQWFRDYDKPLEGSHHEPNQYFIECLFKGLLLPLLTWQRVLKTWHSRDLPHAPGLWKCV